MALLPFDTADFATSRRLMLIATMDGAVRINLPFEKTPEIYRVNWLGMRTHRVQPLKASSDCVILMTAWDPDIFCYEIVW